jgi:hypothetical protein
LLPPGLISRSIAESSKAFWECDPELWSALQTASIFEGLIPEVDFTCVLIGRESSDKFIQESFAEVVESSRLFAE